MTDFPERLVAGTEIGLGEDAPRLRATVHQVRLHKGEWLLSFTDVFTREEIDAWRALVGVPARPGALPATRELYYEHELTGCRCVSGAGAALGEVTALQDGPGGGLLVVAAPAGEVLVPFRSPIVARVDIDARVIELDPPRGLFDDDAL